MVAPPPAAAPASRCAYCGQEFPGDAIATGQLAEVQGGHAPLGLTGADLAGELLSLLCDINYQGATVLVATHDHSLLESIPTRTLVLHQGAISYDGTWPP